MIDTEKSPESSGGAGNVGLEATGCVSNEMIRIRKIRRLTPMKKRIFTSFLSVLLLFSLCQAEIVIHLKKKFIDTYKLKATIAVNDFYIDKAHKKPNPPNKDGDLHIAGRSKTIGLPLVAEIMNAKHQPEALDIVQKNEGSDLAVNVAGVWRIWCEHAGDDTQTQGEPVSTITTTNPPHVFEIHPVLKLGTLDLGDSLVPIDGYTYKTCQDAFYKYENTPCKIIPQKDTVTIETRGVGYNYAEFKIQLREDESIQEVEDGYFVICKVLDLDDEIVSQKTRIVIAKGTKPATYISRLTKDKTLHVIGIPRINLSLVSWRVENSDKNPDALNWNLPLEMILAAVIDE